MYGCARAGLGWGTAGGGKEQTVAKFSPVLKQKITQSISERDMKCCLGNHHIASPVLLYSIKESVSHNQLTWERAFYHLSNLLQKTATGSQQWRLPVSPRCISSHKVPSQRFLKTAFCLSCNIVIQTGRNTKRNPLLFGLWILGKWNSRGFMKGNVQYV